MQAIICMHTGITEHTMTDSLVCPLRHNILDIYVNCCAKTLEIVSGALKSQILVSVFHKIPKKVVQFYTFPKGRRLWKTFQADIIMSFYVLKISLEACFFRTSFSLMGNSSFLNPRELQRNNDLLQHSVFQLHNPLMSVGTAILNSDFMVWYSVDFLSV